MVQNTRNGDKSAETEAEKVVAYHAALGVSPNTGTPKRRKAPCWFWQHEWTEWKVNRTERFKYVNIRRRQVRTFYKRHCIKCPKVQEYHEKKVYAD